MLRILIADDHEIARQGIRSLLEDHPGWEVCADAKDGREAVALAAAVIAPPAPSLHDSAEQPHQGTAGLQIGLA